MESKGIGENMKVVVFDEMNEPIGIGELTRYEDLTITDDNNKVLCKVKTPVIIMEDGEMVAGFECWWMDFAEFVTINQLMLYKQEVKL
jgi:hypothetical protein